MENTFDTRVNLDHAAPEELSRVGGLGKVEVGFLGLAISFSFRTCVNNSSGLLTETEVIVRTEGGTRGKPGTKEVVNHRPVSLHLTPGTLTVRVRLAWWLVILN